MLFHPDLHPYDEACNEATAAATVARRRYVDAVEALRVATLALPAAEAAEHEANANWAEACASFRRLHSLPPHADLGYEHTRHLPVHG